MRLDSIEITCGRTATGKRRMPRTAKGDRIDAATIAHAPAIAVIDEAFADFETIEPATTAGGLAFSRDGSRLMTTSLVVNLTAQLEALDRQRERLAELLGNIDDASIADSRNHCSADITRQSV